MRKFSNLGCSPASRILGMLAMTGSFMVVELVVGNLTNSMALVADSFHMMSDVIALVIAYVSIRMSPKEWSKNTYGWARAEVVGALVNAVFLFALCFSITVEAIKRFLVMETIEDPKLILLVGGIGLAINLFGMLLFGDVGHGHSHDGGSHGHSHDNGSGHENHGQSNGADDNHGHAHGEKKEKDKPKSGHQMNITGVFLHVMADALGSVVVMISASVIWLTDWQYRDYLDPVLSLVIVIIICTTTWPLLRDSTLILLNSIPPHINLLELETRLISSVKGVTSIHELHVWRLVGTRVVASCHLELTEPDKGVEPVQHNMDIAKQVKEFFHQEGIHSTTIQLEYSPGSGFCQFECPREDTESQIVSTDCLESSCCRERPSPATSSRGA